MTRSLNVAVPLAESNVTVFFEEVNVPFEWHLDNEYSEIEAIQL